jgi:hypothetical protein
LRSSPLALVAAIALLSALVRFAVALHVRTPIFYPDEYLYAALSRALDHGHIAEIRGGHVSYLTSAYLGPVLMAPMWLLSGVSVAYRLAQALGAAAFATAAFPAYGIARRIGVSGRASVVAALAAVVVPSGVFTSMLISEAYVYPLFLTALYVTVEAIAAPRVIRVAGAAGLGLLLCFAGGLQFLYFIPVCAAAFLLARASTLRGYLVRGSIVAAVAAYAVHAVEVRGIVSLHYSLATLGSWLAVNLFAFALGTGWVVVPGGLVGLWQMLTGADPRRRAFAFLTTLLLGTMLLEAAVWSASGQGVYERFAFYGAPLVVIALIWAVESGSLTRRGVAAVAYFAALGAVLLPVRPPLHGANDEHSPALHALSNLSIGRHPASVVWGPVLVLLALFVAWWGTSAGLRLAAGGIALSIALSIGASIAYIRHQPDTEIPRAHAPRGSALVTWHDADPFSLMKTLFWNPAIDRVIVLGPGEAPDGYSYTAAKLARDGALRAEDGLPVPGPYVFAPDTTVLNRTGLSAAPFAVRATVPRAFAFGFYNTTRYLAVVGRIFATGGRSGAAVALRLHSPIPTRRTISIRCANGFRRDLLVGPAPVRSAIPVKPGTVQDCWFGLTRGVPQLVGRFSLSVKGSIRLAAPEGPKEG